MKFSPIENKAVIVVTNYLFNSAVDFDRDEYSKVYFKKYNLEKLAPKLAPTLRGDNLVVPREILTQIESSLPILNYTSTNKKLRVIYNDIEKNLGIELLKLDEDSLNSLAAVASDFADLKVSDIKAIGINFISQFDLGDNKLKMLNNKIEEYVPNFKTNREFQVTLVLQLDDCVATYKVRKISGGDDTNQSRIYQIDANFHFNIALNKTQEKINKVSSILQNLQSKYYSIFLEECNNILGMNDAE